MGTDSKAWGVDSVIGIPSAAAEYRLLAKRGWGGFADVWEAEAPGGFRVALRLVRSSPERQACELRAIAVIRGIRHPHLLPIFGAWQEQGQLIIGMELAERSLWDRYVEASHEGLRGIPRRELLGYLTGAASGIDFLNAPRHTVGDREDVGIQHRDVKPRNILLLGHCAKLGDFGMVRVLDGNTPSRPGTWTLAYAAPEFFTTKIAPQSDQYGLAVTYCQMRGGMLPFCGSVAEVMVGHMFREPELDALPEPERAVVARALAKSPDERWPDCRAFIDALSALAEEEGADEWDRLPGDAVGSRDDDIENRARLTARSAANVSGVSDFQVKSTPHTGSGALSDFQVSGLSRNGQSGWKSGEFAAPSDFQVLSPWSGETSHEPDRPLSPPLAASAADGGATGGWWNELWIPCATILFTAGLAFFGSWPYVSRGALSRRAHEPAAPAESSVQRIPITPMSHPLALAAQAVAVAHRSPKPAKPEQQDRSDEPRDEPRAAAVPPRPEPAMPESLDRSEESRAAAVPPRPEPAMPPDPDRADDPGEQRLVSSKPVVPRSDDAPAAIPKPPDPAPEQRRVESPSELARAAYKRGQANLAQRAYGDAIAAFTEALAHEPENGDARLARGVAHHMTGGYTEALADYDAIIKQRPNDSTAFLLRGRAHRALGNLDRAVADLDAVLRLRPDDAPAYVERGCLHHRAGGYDKALADFSLAIKLRSNDPTYYYNRGLVRYESGDRRGAVDDFDRAIAIDPDQADAYLARSEAYARLGQHARAAADHDTFDRLVATHAPAHSPSPVSRRSTTADTAHAMDSPSPVR